MLPGGGGSLLPPLASIDTKAGRVSWLPLSGVGVAFAYVVSTDIPREGDLLPMGDGKNLDSSLGLL